MVAYLMTPVRALLLALALTFTAQAAVADSPATAARTTARSKANANTEKDDTADGLLIIAGIVGVLILLAWLSSRIGDNRSHVVD
jgi:hypothetical protein